MKRWSLGLFLVLVGASFYQLGIQWYTHFVTYPLEAYVGPNEFNAYGAFYESRLVYGLYIPYFVLLLANLGLFFARPAGVGRGWLVVTFVLNLSIMLISLLLAVPLHGQASALNSVTPELLAQLMNVNALRVGAMTASSLIVGVWLVRLLSRAGLDEPRPAL